MTHEESNTVHVKALEKIQCDGELAIEGCHYGLIHENRYRDALNFYRDMFVPDEPVARSLSVDFGEEYECFVAIGLKQNMSIALISDTTGEIVGVRMMNIINKNYTFDTTKLNSEKFKLMADFIFYLRSLTDVFQHYSVEEVIRFSAISVHRDFRNKGIGSKLMKAAISFVGNLGLGPVVVTGEGSSNYAKRIYEKCGFDILAEVYFADYKVDGVVIFQNLGEHKLEKLYGKVVSWGTLYGFQQLPMRSFKQK